MRWGPIGIWEIVVIVGVALLIFGPSQLPKLARGAGKALKSVRDLKDEVTGAVLDDEEPTVSKKRSTTETDNKSS